MRQLSVLFILLTLISFNTTANTDSPSPSQPLEIIRITPEGDDVAAARQIVFTFNQAVVPLGRMERKAEEIPIKIEPAVNCQWRWINTSSLACNINNNDALPESTRYEIMVAAEFTADDGAKLQQPVKHRFITKRANIRHSWFKTWRSPGTPVIRLTFNQPVTRKSVASSMFFSLESNSSIPAKVQQDPNDRSLPEYVQLPGESGTILHVDQQAQNQSSDDTYEEKPEAGRRIWMIEPAQELPLNQRASLQLKPGLVSVKGPEKSIIERGIVYFDTFPEFSFKGIECRNNQGNRITVEVGETNPQKCNPMDSVYLLFSSPVMRSQVKDHLAFSPSFGSNDDEKRVWGDMSYQYSQLSRPHHQGSLYKVYLPRGLKAETTYIITPKGIQTDKSDNPEQNTPLLEDEFGRKLNAFNSFSFITDRRNPNYELTHHKVVLESQIDSDLPLYVTNLEKTSFSYRKLTSEGSETNLVMSKDIPPVDNIQFAVPFDVRGALNGRSGAVYGYLSSQPQAPHKSNHDEFLFAQITPWQVHVKLGHFNSLVWVTDMQTGKPVEGADVTIYRDSITQLTSIEKATIFDRSQTDKDGIARFAGTEKIDPQLDLLWNWKDQDPHIFVQVNKGEDLAIVPLSSSFSIDTWRASDESIYESNMTQYGHLESWGTTAQGIYRVGDTIQYKLYVRNQNEHTLTPAPQEGYTLTINDPMGNEALKLESITLNKFGAYSGEFKVAKTAPVGWYSFILTAKFGKHSKTMYPFSVLVSDFTPSPFKVSNQLNGDLFADGQQVTVQTDARLHSGGPYTKASTRITAMLAPRGFTPDHPVSSRFYFQTHNGNVSRHQIFQTEKPLDDKGELSTQFLLQDSSIVYGRLEVESAVQDERGKRIAAQSQADFVGRDRFVGVRNTQWIYSTDEENPIEYVVANERGEPVSDYPVSISFERQVTKSARVKGAGNAYLTQYTTSWETFSKCDGTSEKTAASCAFRPAQAGYYRAIASIMDTQKRPHKTTLHMWVAGSDYVLWNNQSDVLLPIVPEKKSYQVGDTARYLIKNPFPGAEALVTIERYGIIDSFTTTLEGSTPVLEIPIKEDFLPGFYLSVLVTSPRVEKPLGDGQVDLGKPTYRLGYVTVPVKDPYKTIDVDIKTDQKVYRPRDKVKISMNAQPRHKSKDEPIELAVAVLDEAVFDLIASGTSNYDPYEGFYNLDGLDLRNYNLLTRLIGRQKIEKKGANPGGGGGSDFAVRNLFKFVAYWNPSIKADSQGHAEASFELPDNLTGWRVLVMAVTPSDRLGLGQGNFKVNRPTEVRPVMPNQITERDRFQAGFSVMNRTDKTRTITVDIVAMGPIDKETPTSISKQIKIDPYQRQTVFMPIKTTALPEDTNRPEGELKFTVSAKDDTDADAIIHTLPVSKMRSLETAANYGTTTENHVSEKIAFPDQIFPDAGGVSVVLSPSVISNVEGAFRYIRDYPYLCWEQRLTKGVMAAHYQNLKGYIPGSFTWDQSKELPQATLDNAASFQAPNGGMTYYRALDKYVSPYLSAYTALAFNWLKDDGYEIPVQVENRLHDYLLNMLRNDTMPTFYSHGMRSTVHAVALAALAESGKITDKDLQRYRPHVKEMGLFGKAHFLQAALTLSGNEEIAIETTKDILGHANQTGGKFIFSETLDDSYSRILSSPLRENCAILDSLTRMASSDSGGKLVQDIPFKLVRTITQTRENRDHWENTQENMFCMNALADYSQQYESTSPNMTVATSFNNTLFGEASFNDLRNPAVTFIKQMQPENPGTKAVIDINKQGEGRFYYTTRLQYAPKFNMSKPQNAGIEITREYSVERDGKWQLLKPVDTLKRGELIRADIYLSVPAARNFVVVDDPLPGGLEAVNRDLATASKLDADKGNYQAAGGSWYLKFNDWIGYNTTFWSFYHKELRHDRAVFYSSYLPAGNYHLSYTAQAIAEGKFISMPVHAEEMYDPDVYGKGVIGELNVEAP